MVTAVQTDMWQAAGEFLLDVRDAGITGRISPRLSEIQAAATGMGEAIDSDGGFLVPGDYSEQVWNRTYNTNEILRRCEDFGKPKGNRHYLPYVDESSRADGSRFGGFRAYFVGEGDEITASRPAFGLQERRLHTIAGLGYTTDELAEDAPNLAQIMSRMAAQEFGFVFADRIVNGSAGGPLGLLNSTAKITVSKLANQPAATVQGANIQAMMARQWGPSQRNAVWLYNQELLDVLPTLVTEAGYGSGTTAVETPLWNWDGNAHSGGWPTLCGRPAIPVEQCQAPGTEGDLILTDLSQYGIVAKSRDDYSIHVRFLAHEGVFRFILRCDGSPLWSGPLTPKYGTDTLSPIVTLESRV